MAVRQPCLVLLVLAFQHHAAVAMPSEQAEASASDVKPPTKKDMFKLQKTLGKRDSSVKDFLVKLKNATKSKSMEKAVLATINGKADTVEVLKVIARKLMKKNGISDKEKEEMLRLMQDPENAKEIRAAAEGGLFNAVPVLERIFAPTLQPHGISLMSRIPSVMELKAFGIRNKKVQRHLDAIVDAMDRRGVQLFPTVDSVPGRYSVRVARLLARGKAPKVSKERHHHEKHLHQQKNRTGTRHSILATTD